ncbi:hypothetical protein NQZ68_013054, partial [Dissostichus eleginoides]
SLWLFAVVYFCLRFVTTIKELSYMRICLGDNVNQEGLASVKTLMSSPPEQTEPPSVANHSPFVSGKTLQLDCSNLGLVLGCDAV